MHGFIKLRGPNKTQYTEDLVKRLNNINLEVKKGGTNTVNLSMDAKKIFGSTKIFEIDKETQDIIYKRSIEIIERNNIIRTWLNLKANELFGIKLLIH